MNIIRVLPALALCLIAPIRTDAALVPLLPNDFALGAITLNFSGIAFNTEVNGLTVNNVLFEVTESGLPMNGIVLVDSGPGVTNNITPPNIVSLSNLNGLALEVSLPGPMTQFGYGYGILAADSISAATTIRLFSGITPVGSIDFAGAPDPIFTGGFAGVGSTVPFDRAVLTFSTLGSAFAVDNVTFANTAANVVPEQGWTLILFATGVISLFCLPLRRPKPLV